MPATKKTLAMKLRSKKNDSASSTDEEYEPKTVQKNSVAMTSSRTTASAGSEAMQGQFS
jgi:hypothetical protein